MPRQIQLPGYNQRLKTFRQRFAQLLEDTKIRQYEFEHVVRELDEDRIKYWKFVGAPTQESLTLLSQLFRVPMEYLWPPMPDDGAELDRDRIRRDLQNLQKRAMKGRLSPQEQEHYEVLLGIEQKLSGSGYITFAVRPVPKLVCILQRLPLRPEHLPPWTAVWEGGAMVVPMDGVNPSEPVYAYKLPHRIGEFDGGTLVIFRPLYVEPEARDLVIGVRKGLPYIAEGREFPKDGTPLGRIVMSFRQH